MKLTGTEDIQKVLLEDYIIVSKIWDKNNYFYCLTGGTVLGAVRHKGFIPWDDDFDVGLARPDYTDFVKSTHKELPDYMKLFLRKKTQQYVIIDTRYEIEYDKENNDALFEDELLTAHPTLDLQIFDGTPNNPVHRVLFCFYIMYLRARIKMVDRDKIHTANWRPFWENMMISIIKKLPRIKKSSMNKLIKKYNRAVKRYSFNESRYIADFIGKYHFKDIYPKKWWCPTIVRRFEGVNVPIPNGYHDYLKRIYGDYMKLPDMNNQMQHIKKEERG